MPVVAFAELLLNRLQLRTQISLPLRIGKLGLHIFLQFLLDLRDLELRGDMSLSRAHPFFHIELFQQRLLLGDIDVQVRRPGNPLADPHYRCCARPRLPAPARPESIPSARAAESRKLRNVASNSLV